MSFPVDGRRADASIQTEVRMAYDDNFIYVGVVCHGDDDYVIQTLKRDTDFWRWRCFCPCCRPCESVDVMDLYLELIQQMSRQNP